MNNDQKIDRRTLLKTGFSGATVLGPFGSVLAQTRSLSDLGGSIVAVPDATIFTAQKIITLDPSRPMAEAVAVVNGRILWAGKLDEVERVLGDQPHRIDRTFADKVIVPGFIAQHDHPVLVALTMPSEILSIEDWVLPTGTVPAVRDKQDFTNRLSQTVNRRDDPDEPVVTWG